MTDDLTPFIERENAAKRGVGSANARNRREVLSQLLASPEGRKFLWNDLHEAHVFSQTYVPGSFDGSSFNEGMRAKGLKLFNEITRGWPASYVQMTKENASVALQPQDTSDE